jgi:hypothetical protein
MPRSVIGKFGSQFTLDTFAYADEIQARERPIAVEAALHMLTSKDKAAPPNSFWSPEDQNFDLMESFDKGHLVANEFLNENSPFNIVPMYSSFNQKGGVWSEMEQTIAKAMSSGTKITLMMNIEYQNPDPRIPSAFVVTAWTGSSYLAFKDVALANLRITHLPTAASALTINQLIEQLGEDVAKFIIYMNSMSTYVDFVAEKQLEMFDYRIQKHNGGALASPDVVPRPYGFLDSFWLVGPEGNAIQTYLKRCKWVGGSDFKPRQKTLVRLVNRVRNGGLLKSDYPTDTKDALIEGSGNAAAQVDHVWPQAKYGPNLFSNALVAYGKFNNTASAMNAIDKYTKHTV